MDPVVDLLSEIATEFRATATNPDFWIAAAAGIVLAAVALTIGVWSTRRVGLLPDSATTAELIGVGLSAGLLILASGWAALVSSGRSSFTPIAVALVIAVLPNWQPRTHSVSGCRRQVIARGSLASIGFLVVAALIYGMTLAPSPRDGVQPVEFYDTAFYSILGRDLASTGLETIFSPSGFTELPGLPYQSWYHWGEIWLAAAVIGVFDVHPIHARHFSVLPVVLLAAAALTGTLVRRFVGTDSRAALALGIGCALFLSPIPMPGLHFAAWARGGFFGVTLYGLAVVSVLVALYSLTRIESRPAWPLALFFGAVGASLVATHIVIAVVAAVGALLGAAVLLSGMGIERRAISRIADRWARPVGLLLGIAGVTLVYGLATGHGVPASAASSNVAPFNAAWLASLLLLTAAGGLYFTIPVALRLRRPRDGRARFVVTSAVTVSASSALAWGAHANDFNSFHVFFGALAVIITPIAAVTTWTVWSRLRERASRRSAALLAFLAVVQIEVCAAYTMIRLDEFGAGEYEPIPLSLLGDIQRLPTDSKMAYACQPGEEAAVWDPKLVSISVHTGRNVIPMCFQSGYFDSLSGSTIDPELPGPLFRHAPQRELFPTADAMPRPWEVHAFMRKHGIGYIFEDAKHPNTLLPQAQPVLVTERASVFRVP